MKNISLITGGAGGMGLASAKIIGKDHDLILCDLNEEHLKRAQQELADLGIEAETMICDVSNQSAVEEAILYAAGKGHLASIIHTAGVSPQMGKADLIMKINALGTIYITEAFLKVAKPESALINIASMAGYLIPGLILPKRAYKYALSDQTKFFKKMMSRVNLFPQKQRAGLSYSISKNFVSWYSKKSAAQFGAKGARILSISPGSFDTDMGRLEEKSGSAAMLGMAAIKRFGKPEEIAELIAFMASTKQGYTTGIDIPCDGGVTAGYSAKAMKEALANQSH
tara:strand:- start:2032 stop:2880 length:849 start_codon:yes stop_codon:yes gene_type:complete